MGEAGALAMIDQAVRNLRVLFPISAAALLLVVLVLFRRLGPVALVMTVSGLSVTWTMAFAGVIDREFHTKTTRKELAVPTLLMLARLLHLVGPVLETT